MVYKRLASIRGVPDLDAITEELVDRYGPVPPLVDTLMRVMELRRWLKDLRVMRVRRRGDAAVLEFDPSTPLEAGRLVQFVRGSPGRLRVTSGSALEVQLGTADHDGTVAELRALLQKLAAT